MKHLAILLFLVILGINSIDAQQYVNKVKFFEDTSVVNASLTFNIKKLLTKKSRQGLIFPGVFACKLGDSLNVNDNISIEVRGHSRRATCYIPPLKLIYKNNKEAAFYKLKSLKLVNTCAITKDDDQNLLKEFIIYKIYNQITDRSFRARLLKLSYIDSSGSRKTITQHAFLLEDVKELAKRNACDDWTGKKFGTEATDRRQMTMVAIFEYMIGNTDWAVPNGHNIRLIHSNIDTLSRPYAVPYDFDYSGLVNTTYAIPDDRLGIENVRQRLYRGFPRLMEELNEVLDVFKKQKTNIYAIINNFNLLTPTTKRDMIDYLDGFYATIGSQSEIRETFITHARSN